ncbi:nucleotide sugar dehydrogenase [Parasphingorhabdus halotolerans]|uniref:Nucleotide sugar dehydrogenase n=1 Tax=Parasphingorhabdus halotolerans TaxID=2725558 RepID=A0A6H2DMX9_9SPHN|nr:nucleotide sugar dehydrogenase [Parasphingorhabdus halotolerans]QJB69740.1 nucleotide sugar dehydrogenase [Parasphingorhabdus halotolerans]
MTNIESVPSEALFQRVSERESKVGIIGMGYVGLPLAVAAFDAGFSIFGFDVDPSKIESINNGVSPIGRIGNAKIQAMRDAKRFEVTSEFSNLAECDVVIICVPTPLNKYREPDLSYVVDTTRSIASNLRPGQIISLESTTYPGTTRDVMRPILEEGGLKSGEDFFLAYSPEREDPGNPDFHTASIPKVVGGDGQAASRIAEAFYGAVVDIVVPVASCEVAEAVKLTENIFRSVNIALVNELKVIYDRMGINVWEVIDAAKTKPFGFMPFYPGPGLGGHCIPIDPFYLTWKAREYHVPTRFIELAGEINTNAPYLVVDQLMESLSTHRKKCMAEARILMLGVAYKRNVEDTRESPAFSLIEEIETRGGVVDFHDPYVAVVPHMREHENMSGRESIDLTAENVSGYDAVLVCTDHDGVDYKMVGDAAKLIVDTRNVMAKFDKGAATVVRA